MPLQLPQIPKQKLFIILSVVLGLLTFFMINVYLQGQKKAAEDKAREELERERANLRPVFIARSDIAPGKEITADMVESKIVSDSDRDARAVADLSSVFGKVVTIPIRAGEQISLDKLAYARASGTLAQSTPVGKRAVTISVDNIASLAGMVKPGDYVDIIASVPVPAMGADGKQATQLAMLPLFQNVQILAVGQNLGAQARQVSRYASEEKAADAASALITVALNPQEANIISFVQDQGKLRLVLRSPSDTQMEQPRPVSWDTVFQYVFPPSPEPERYEAPQPTVEVYRGYQR
ncbi:MAG: Flp pilus assembly protein CpaB, partial [Candidatus Omnitrophica bacterium]|nr:Flp pilus assembly protein CpaB [Candidatus Omnitrophota bacterium]